MRQNTELENEERLNTISHGVGFVLAILGMILLLLQNSKKSHFSTVSIVVYSLTLISMFGVSTLYHYSKNPILKKKLRIVDHINIYFLIAGTYTPVALITLISGNGWLILYVVWAFAIFGTFFKIYYTGKFEFLSLLLYAIMGWLIVIDIDNLSNSLPKLGMYLLWLGGAFYTIGIIFYAIRRIPNNHFIWHLFVIGGAISHWLMIYWAVV
ncbi:hemolysin III family protein [Aurantibacter sp.]|uniref:PAQR family membrane homeostasis protein TrhA n=1 Tax=Aurantibacter sp. TaxID=2807103 RepID=UPI003267C2C4